MSSSAAFRYGAWDGGRDPLEPPYDIAQAVDEIGDRVLAGESPRQALRDLLRRGTDNLRGLDDVRRKIAKRQREARQRGQLDGTLQQVRELLDEAVELEKQALFPDPSDAARMAELELETLPQDTARAVQQLKPYQWRSPEARAAYEQIDDLLRREVLDSQFRGMKQALESATPEDMQRVKDMLADLNQMLEADARGEHTQEQFDEFMAKHGEFFPSQPGTLEELVDELARRAAAAQRLMDSLTPQQRQELGELMQGAMDMDLQSQMAQLGDALRNARPDLPWGGRERMSGQQGMGLGDATTALQELADLDDLESALGQDYPGASLDDIDEDAVQRALGRGALDDVRALQRIEKELQVQGYLVRDAHGRLELSPRAVRRLGATALRKVFSQLDAKGRGGHDVQDAGAAGDITGSSRAWEFGDEQPLDVVRTVRNAVLRSPSRPTGRVRLHVDDFEVVETERRTTAAVALLVDLSFSMELRGTWAAAKQTSLALHSLVSTQFPQDAIEVIGFSDYAQVLRPEQLAGLDPQRVQGTNLQHALMLAGRFIGKHPQAEPIVLVVTDGEPTAHLTRDGYADFCWPPLPETLELTMAEVERITRRGATINVFMLDDEPRLVSFVEHLAERNGGRVFAADPARLGEYVVSDYLRARRGRRGGR
ncbi:MAG: von Willebrand factor type [Frankiales bacterium]|nr:von Willebrand factor type [Frankiales bacterium]MCW2586009.1 von Willebrand factor type [Frankiales bacterium]